MRTVRLPIAPPAPSLFIDLDVSDAEWHATPEPVRRGMQRLWEELQRLREQAGQTSHNSSQPPSTDPPSVTPRAKSPTGRAPGGQPGHPGHTRALVPEDEVTEIIPVRPLTCGQCGHPLAADAQDAAPHRIQRVDLPPIQPTVIEYQLHTLTCPSCGQPTTATLPPDVSPSLLGPRAVAMIATCTGRYHLSKRATAALLDDCFGLTVSDATICAAEQTVSAALAAPVAAVADAVRQAPVKHIDETGWAQQRDPDPLPTVAEPPDTAEVPVRVAPTPTKLPKAWLWVVVTAVATLFCIRRSRGSAVAHHLLGEDPVGIIISDRWSAYTWLGALIRQLCWAHLQRDFTKISERAGPAGAVGRALLEQTHQLFHYWHRYRDGTLEWAGVQQAMAPIQAEVGQLLRTGAALIEAPSTVATCAHLLKWEASLWTFVRVPGVEPTNNAAERSIRAGVLARHVSFGTQSSAGSRFIERVMTAVATCTQHQRNILDYLTSAVEAQQHGQAAPSLLPPATSLR